MVVENYLHSGQGGRETGRREEEGKGRKEKEKWKKLFIHVGYLTTCFHHLSLNVARCLLFRDQTYEDQLQHRPAIAALGEIQNGSSLAFFINTHYLF